MDRCNANREGLIIASSAKYKRFYRYRLPVYNGYANCSSFLSIPAVLFVGTMQPRNSPMASSPFPRKIGSALAAFENTINKNKVNGGPEVQSVLKDAAASPGRIVPSWKKSKFRCNTPGAPAKDAIDSSKALATPTTSMKKRMEAFASANKLPFSELEDTPADTAEKNVAQVPVDPPMKDSETRSPDDTSRECQTSDRGDKKGVSRQNYCVELAPPRISSIKCMRSSSVLSTDTVPNITGIWEPAPLTPTYSKKQTESSIIPTKKVARWRVGQRVKCANDEDAIRKVKESPILTKEQRLSEFLSNQKGESEISLENLPALESLRSDSSESLLEEPLKQSPKENKRKNTKVIRVHKDQASAKVVSDGCPSHSLRSSSYIPSPERWLSSSRHTSGEHSLSPVKVSKRDVGTIRSTLKCGKSPIKRCEEQQSRDFELEANKISYRSLIKPGKSSMSSGSSKCLRVTFADGVVVPRREPRRYSMMSICTDKDTLPKQPRRHSMSDVQEVRRKSNRLQDPALHQRRFHRTAVKIQDFVRQKLRRLRFVKIIAATRIQALYRGVLQRMRHRLAILEQRLAVVEAKHKRQVSKLQAKKWKMMEAYRHKAEGGIRECDATATAIAKVVEELRRENSKLRDQNSNIRESCSLLREMNGQIESTLKIHNDNFATMREAMGVLAERNARNVRMSDNYKVRSEKVKKEVLTTEKKALTKISSVKSWSRQSAT